MQTFLPYADFAKSAECLDRQRLGKQRVEVKQILGALLGGKGWANHPAVKMWKGHEAALVAYGKEICIEWIRRGYRDSLYLQFDAMQLGIVTLPSWVGDDKFHASHRSNLLRKNPDWYRKLWPDEPDSLPYVWPTKETV